MRMKPFTTALTSDDGLIDELGARVDYYWPVDAISSPFACVPEPSHIRDVAYYCSCL